MSIDITVPSVGESISEGTIARWLKKDGEAVRQGEPLFELETDKATTEIPAPATGTLHIAAADGKTVAVGASVGSIEEGEAPKADSKPRDEENGKVKEAKETKEDKETKVPPEQARKAAEETKPPRFEVPEPRREVQTEPRAETVASVADASGSSRLPSEKRQPMSAIRQRIAERMLESRNRTATLTTFNEADLSTVLELRARGKDRFQKKHGVKLGLMSFFVKACVEAIRAHPIVNARIDGSDVVYRDACNIGVAVSTEKGLFVPVLRHAERMSLAEIERTIAELAEKARDGKITVQDLQDGTFTITNGGVFGSLLSTPILNPPQSAILGMHTIQERPIAMDRQVVIRPMMYLALSYDHRLIDGRDAVGFLVRVKECIEDPLRMLLDV